MEPLRIAVLPFAEVNDQGEFTDVDSGLLIDHVSVVSQDLGEKPRSLVRKFIQSELDNTAIDMLAPWVVNAKLQHAGFADQNVDFIYPKIFSTPASEICSKFLDCDAVLRGKVTHWSRSYYAIQSVTTVGFEIEIVSARDNKVLYSAKIEDSDSRGITKIPTGFSSIVLEPIRGLDNDIAVQLAQRLTRKVIEPLRVDNRPEVVKSVPPAIGAVAHSAVFGEIKSGESLIVMAIGSSGKKGSFSLGDKVVNIPMVETNDRHYVGEYIPLPSDKFEDLPIVVSLTDSFGRKASLQAKPEVSVK